MWLFALTLLLSLSVLRHAEAVAARLGEPYGTLVLTMSVASVEIATVITVMFTGQENPTLARDTIFSVVMLVLNGLVGAMLVLGALRWHEQEYNLQGGKAFVSMIVALAALGLMLPDFTAGTSGFDRRHSVMQVVLSLALYALFLLVQTTRHRVYFLEPEAATSSRERAGHSSLRTHRPLLRDIGLLLINLVLVVALSRPLGVVLNHGIEELGFPSSASALLIAALVLTPEGSAAILAALRNQMQRATNVALGSALSTIALTIPAVLLSGMLTGHAVQLGISRSDLVLLALTLLLSTLTFGSGRTNILQGAIHLALFAAYLMLLFDP